MMKKISVLKYILLFTVISYSQNSVITINPDDINQNVVFGGDNKLTIKAWAEGQTDKVSSKLFGDMNLKIIRVPIFALQDIDDPIYDNVITVINSVKKYKPDVKVFASIANGDGYGINYHGAPKFPSGWIGCCPNNVYSLNLTAYSAYLDSFMQKMTSAGITIDYLGPYNEDPGDKSDYSKIIDQMTELGDTEMVGLERFALGTSISDVDDIEDQVTIVGSHFYDDETIPESDWDNIWATLVEKSEHPVWYTESTRYSNPDRIDLLIAGMDNIFAPIRGGVESVIFYQVCKRFVYANGNALPIKYSGFKNIVNNSEGNVITSASNNANIKVVVFGKENNLDVHIINNNIVDNTVDLQLLDTYLGDGLVTRKVWTASDIGTESAYNVNNNSHWDILVPATSYSHLKINLNKAILSTNNIANIDKNIKIISNPLNGDVALNLPNSKDGDEILIKIHSIDGREMFSEKNTYKSNLLLNHNLLPGVYIITIKTADHFVYNSKFILF